MIFLISLAAAILFTLAGQKGLKNHPVPFYLSFTGIAAAVLILKWNRITYDNIFSTWIWPIFDRAAFGTAFFALVMFAGALPVRTRAVKILMPIRGQLSILACILTLGHNAAYGKTYFLWLFTGQERLSGYLLYASICSLCMIGIMLPLFVTSFVRVRRKMKPRKWKKLQRHAYLFYTLLYIHVMLLNVPQALNHVIRCQWNIAVYTAVFSAYLICRLLKAYAGKHSSFPLEKAQRAGVTAVLLIVFAAAVFIYGSEDGSMLSKEITESPETDVIGIEETVQTEEMQSAGYHDGTYQGTAFGYIGDITVEITVEGGKISSISFASYEDEEDYRNFGSKMLQKIIADPEGTVDTISGATFTTGAVLKAYQKALEQAK